MDESGDIPNLTVGEIYSQFYFIFVCSGIIMSIVVGIGIIGNSITLVILCRKSLRSAPVCLLQCLTVHALVNMMYAVYSDIEPAIRSYMAALDMMGLTQNIFVDLCDLYTVENKPASCLQVMLACHYLDPANSSADVNGTGMCVGNSSGLQQVQTDTTLQTTGQTNHTENQFGNLSLLEYSFLGNNLGFANEGIEINSFIRKAVERFFAYTIVYFGLLVTLCLALERCIAVYVPLKAARLITVRRTRLAIFGISVVCCCVHLPQLLLEITRAVNSMETLQPESGDLLIASWRRDYERFYTVSSLFLCVVLFIINVTILRKVTVLRKRYASIRHMRKTKHAEINVTLIIVILIFFQLPLYIFINVVVFISKENYIQNFSFMTKLLTSIRLLYVTQSAANFLVYCVFAHQFRNVLRDTCESLAATSGLTGYYGNRTEEVPLEHFGELKITARKEFDSATNCIVSASGCNDTEKTYSEKV